MSKRGRIIAAVVALVVVGAIVAFIALGASGGGPEIETAQVTEQELAVTVTASGKVEAGIRADLYPPTQGIIDELYVSDGATVTTGTEIAKLDTEPLELQVAQAQAGLSAARAQLTAVDAQAPGSADLSAARANVEAASQAHKAAKQQLKAVKDQAPSNEQIAAAEAATRAAKSAYDNAKAAYETAAAVSPDPSSDPTVTALAAARDQAYAGYLAAKSQESQLKGFDLSAAKAQAEAAVDQTYAAWKSAEAQLARLKSGDTETQRRAAIAAVDQASKALRAAEAALDDATFVAPIDGIVIFNSPGAAAAAASGASGSGTGGIVEGSAVSPASAPFSVVDLNALKFTAEVDEAEVDRVKEGMKVNISLDSFPGEEIASTVMRVNPVAQPTATGGTVFQVEIPLEDTGKDILIGMKGDAEIEVSSRGGAITIPVEALFSEGGTDYVYVVEDSKLKRTEITVGATTDTEVEVLSGLEAGATVALSGATQYTDGMQVKVSQ